MTASRKSISVINDAYHALFVGRYYAFNRFAVLRRSSLMRACQPAPVARYASITPGSSRNVIAF